MEALIRKMGNSHGVLIPKPILAQLGIEDRVDLRVRNGVLEIRAVPSNRREGWAEAAAQLAVQEGEGLVWPEFPNEGDSELTW